MAPIQVGSLDCVCHLFHCLIRQLIFLSIILLTGPCAGSHSQTGSHCSSSEALAFTFQLTYSLELRNPGNLKRPCAYSSQTDNLCLATVTFRVLHAKVITAPSQHV